MRVYTNFTILVLLIVMVILVGRSADILFPRYNSTDIDKKTNLAYDTQTIKNITQHEVIVRRNDTLHKILRQQGLPYSDIKALVISATNQNITSRLKIGQKIIFSYISLLRREDNCNSINKPIFILDRMIFFKDKINSIEFIREKDKFTENVIKAPLKKRILKYSTNIGPSFITSLKRAKMGADSNVIVHLINLYSYPRISSYNKNVKKKYMITIITEKYVTDKGEFSHYGNILYAHLHSRGENYTIYKYSPTGKTADLQFFFEDGASIKHNKLRHPVNVVRISSPYGYRKNHPVLNCSKMHKGVDFAASIGTPIYAAGHGIISFIGWKSGYGRFIIINHDNILSTAYAHASQFARGLKRGATVKQGEIIAYVGKSGRATGPHLHYEVRINGKQVNPMQFKSKPQIKLSGEKLTNFRTYQRQINNLSKTLNNVTELEAESVHEIKLF